MAPNAQAELSVRRRGGVEAGAAASAPACGLAVPDNLIKGTDNQIKGTDNQTKGTDNQTKRTERGPIIRPRVTDDADFPMATD